jgi:uncharacterized protein YbbC (DUF1343 family)
MRGQINFGSLAMLKIKHFYMIGILISLFSAAVYANEPKPVLSGIDSLFTPEYLHLIKGKRIAIVANSASVNRDEYSTVDLLVHYPRSEVVAIFTPEHGFDVKEDQHVGDARQNKIPVYSLYGPRKSPTFEQLEGVDVIVFDLETVGLRYYTYITTLAFVMKAAAKEDIPIIVLDRVNPLGGKLVTGATLDKKFEGNFAAYYPIPTRYGLTMGELARYYNRYYKIGADLKVVALKNWHRDMLFSDTDLTWHAPSPALPTFEQAYLYSIFGPYEALQLAVGRSQTNKEAFRRYGAPWISAKDAEILVSELNNLELPGLTFEVAKWIPDRAKYQNQQCYGFSVQLNDLNEVSGLKSFIAVTEVLANQFNTKLGLAGMDGMIGSAKFRKAMLNNEDPEEIIEKLKLDNSAFMRQRKKILLY